MSYSSQKTSDMESFTSDPPSTKSKFYRRRSVADESVMTQEYIQDNIETLTRLWDEVHMSEDNRVTRLHTAYEHIRTLVDDMVAAETKMVESVKDGIASGEEKIKNLRKELNMDCWECRHPYPSIARLREVEREEKALHEQYEACLDQQNKVLERLDNLCHRLGKNALEYFPETKKLCSQEELQHYQSIVADLEAQLNERFNKAVTYQTDLRLWCRNLGRAYGENDEIVLKAFLNGNIDDDSFRLTTSIMDTIERFWHELSGMHESWLLDMDMEWTTRYEELKELWDNCHISVQERVFPSRFDPARHSQEDIDAMSKAIERLKILYAERQPIYKILADWKESWKQKLDMEEKKKDVNYYQSRERGHNLMRDAQHERQLNEVKLPLLKKSLTSAYNEYRKNHPADQILVEGYEPLEFVEWIETEHKLSKERERTVKLAQKKHQNELLKTPQTNLKSKIGIRTPAASSMIPSKQPRLTAEPQFSIITPTRAQEHGPKTSSPKEICTTPSTPKRKKMI